ncbi:hypothetical protein XaC1_531 [Xanthomonas phage XaC1]|nr:hypothetical protein XaC1_531 [Xanthomonas phage XaC1]
MNYNEFIEKILETKPEFIRNINTLHFNIEDMYLEVNFDSGYFLVERRFIDDEGYQVVACWNVYELDYVNVILAKNHQEYLDEMDVIPDNLSKDDFFNYTVNHEVLISYEEYLNLHNVYKRLEEFYGI